MKSKTKTKAKANNKTKTKIHEINSTNDMKYRGPLTYQHFRMIGWVLIALAQVMALYMLGESLFPDKIPDIGRWSFVLSVLSQMASPFLLVANFAVILSGRESYKKLLVRFGALSAGTVAAFILVYERYAIGIFTLLSGSRAQADEMLEEVFSEQGFMAFNLFLDLFLCTLVMFFLEYTPKRFFRGRKLIVFRLLALTPILYEAVSVLLKILVNMNNLRLPVRLFPFLTTKPPIGFVVFVALALFIKRRERRFIHNGKTIEEYRAYLATNSNSWHFSVHAAIIMAVAAVLDFIILTAASLIIAAEQYGTELYDFALEMAGSKMVDCGFGASMPLIFLAPLMLLFSYNRAPKHPQLDRVIPIAGVVLVSLAYAEGILYGLRRIF